LSYSFLRTYFHFSNITDSTTISTLGGDLKGTLFWLMIMLITVVSAIAFVVYYTFFYLLKRPSVMLKAF